MQTQSYPLPRGSPYGGTARLGSLREWRNTNRAVRVYELPPSFRFPPLREGNREGRAYSVPPAGRGNLKELKGVGFLRACLLAALPSRALLPPCERDARAPSTRDAGNAGVPPAMPTVRGKTYPFKLLAGGTEPVRGSPREAGGTCRRGAIVNSARAIGMTGDGAVDDGDLNVVLFNFGSGC